jgi:hypothetical protein
MMVHTVLSIWGEKVSKRRESQRRSANSFIIWEYNASKGMKSERGRRKCSQNINQLEEVECGRGGGLMLGLPGWFWECFVTPGVVGHSLRCLMKDLGDSIDGCTTEETTNLSWKSDEKLFIILRQNNNSVIYSPVQTKYSCEICKRRVLIGGKGEQHIGCVHGIGGRFGWILC